MPNKVYIAAGTPITWKDTGGSAIMDLGGLAAAGVRVGAQHDLGSGSRSEWYEWRAVIDGFDSAPVPGEHVDFYIATSDGTLHDGDIGTADAAGAVDDLPNFKRLGIVTVQTVTEADELVASGIVRIVARYVSPVVHNNTVDDLLSTADVHQFILTPIPPEIQ